METMVRRTEMIPGIPFGLSGQLAEAAGLKGAVLTEDWQDVYHAACECFGQGYCLYRYVKERYKEGAYKIKQLQDVNKNFSELLKYHAKQGDIAELLSNVEKGTGNSLSDASIEALMNAQVKDVPILDALDGGNAVGLSSMHAQAKNMAISNLMRGLLGIFHAQFNLALAYYKNDDRYRPEKDYEAALKAEVENFASDLNHYQQDVYKALIGVQDIGVPISAMHTLSAFIEEKIPKFGELLARAYLTADAFRNEGKGGKSEKIGRIAGRAGGLMRESFASVAACYCLSVDLIGKEIDDKIKKLLNKITFLPFETHLPNGKNVSLSRLSDCDDGQFVEVEGFVSRFEIEKTDKLLCRFQVVNASGSEQAWAVTIYNHLPHLGVTIGSHCRLNGIFKRESKLFNNKPCIEIDKLSLGELSKNSWRIAFLRMAEPWYRRWPNGINMDWAVGPQEGSASDDVPSKFGAGELIFSKFSESVEVAYE